MTNPADRFAIIPVTHGPAPSDAIAVGDIREVFEYIRDTPARDDAIARLDKARMDAKQISRAQNVIRALQVATFCDSVDRFARRQDAFIARKAERARADAAREAEEEAKRIQAELDALPDPDDPNPFSGKSEKPEPSLEIEGDDGELPEALAKYSEAPELKPVKPKNYVSQPIAIQLNSEE